MTQLSAYIHWPFCLSKCPYCDFASAPGRNQDSRDWQTAYLREIAHYQNEFPKATLHTIYFGGGTPSIMHPATIQTILDALAKTWSLSPDIEITLEANPSTLETQKLKAFRSAGINRLSLGLQSLRDPVLRFLGRPHDAAEARAALDSALALFPRVSADLIYAYANQTEQDWQSDLTAITQTGLHHLSLYQLTIEPHTPFARATAQGHQLALDDARAAALYTLTNDVMESCGLPRYEISNYAAPGEESRHNLAYWTYAPYIGLGPAAHGRLPAPTTQRTAIANTANPQAWRKAVETQGHGTETASPLTQPEAMQEALLMGLRLTQGIQATTWQTLFNRPFLDSVTQDSWSRLAAQNLVEQTPTHYRCTPSGLLALDTILTTLNLTP